MLSLLGHVHAWGPWAPVGYIAVFAAAVIAMLPTWPLTIAAGALFGLWRGTLIAFTGATLGSSVAFLIARHGARPIIIRRFAASRRFAALNLAVQRDGRRIVFLLRLSPFVPFNVINYLLGLTPLRFRDYLLACIGMTPVIVTYVYGGFVAGEAVALSGQATVPHSASYYAVLAAGFAATVAVAVVVTRTARRAIIDVSL